MPAEDQEPRHPPGRIRSALVATGTAAGTLWDFVSRAVMLTKEQERQSGQLERLNRQLEKLNEQIFELAKDVQRMAGRSDAIENRFDDRDKMIEAIIALKMHEAIERLRSELKK